VCGGEVILFGSSPPC